MVKMRVKIRRAFKILPNWKRRRIRKAVMPRETRNPLLELTKIIARVKKRARKKLRKNGR